MVVAAARTAAMQWWLERVAVQEGSRPRVWWRRPRGGEREGRPVRVRIVGCLIPCREAVIHDVLINCIGTYIYIGTRWGRHVLGYTKEEGAKCKCTRYIRAI
jgi:hypothetical protein